MRLWFLMNLFFTLSTLAQEPSSAVIAVGEAQAEKDSIYFLHPHIVPGEKENSSQTQEFIDLLRNDFAFYRHKFDQRYDAKNSMDPSSLKESLFAGSSEKFAVVSALRYDKSTVQATVGLVDVSQKKIIDLFKTQFTAASLRAEGHRLADAIYQSITKKGSIFLSKIVFVSDRTTRGKDVKKEIYMMDFDGRRVERLTFYDSTVISPALSPDNTKMMFSLIDTKRTGARRRLTRNIDLKMMDLRNKKVTTISDKPGINSGAIFNADGTKIYFTMSYSGNADIFEMELATGKTRKITNHYSEDVDPSINKDGSLMSFLSNRPGRAHVYTMDPSGTEKDVKRISFVGQFNATPRFSKDGKEIVFVSWVDDGFDVYRIDAQGNNLVRMTKNSGSNEEPSFSPDGEFLIYTSQKPIGRKDVSQDIFIMNREGEVIGQLTENFGRCFTPRWTN